MEEDEQEPEIEEVYERTREDSMKRKSKEIIRPERQKSVKLIEKKNQNSLYD